MIAEAPGPLDFQMLLQLFGEKMSGTDPEETIMAGWHLFDPTASGEMAVELSRTSSAPVVSRLTVLPRPRLPRCSTRSNPLVANSTTASSPASCSADPTSRFSRRLATENIPTFSYIACSHDSITSRIFCNNHDARFINKDLGRIIAVTTTTTKHQNCLPLNVEPGSPNRQCHHLGSFTQKKSPLILERTELIIREASKRFLFETFLSRSFCPSFGREGGFLFILPSKQRKKKMQRKSSTGLRVCSLFPSSVIVFLSS